MGAHISTTPTGSSSNKKATARRVSLALSIYAGRKRPTLKMLARLVGLSPQSLYQARFRRKHNGRNGANGHQPKREFSIADLAQSSPEERVAALRAVGIDRMVGWLIEAERSVTAQ